MALNPNFYNNKKNTKTIFIYIHPVPYIVTDAEGRERAGFCALLHPTIKNILNR